LRYQHQTPGSEADQNERQKHATPRHGGSPLPKKPEKPDWLRGAKTKADAKSAYRAQSRKHHPDLGGNADTMKQVNSDWDKWEGHFKEAMLLGFTDELEKIAAGMRHAPR